MRSDGLAQLRGMRDVFSSDTFENQSKPVVVMSGIL